jgi:hypothetical protein
MVESKRSADVSGQGLAPKFGRGSYAFPPGWIALLCGGAMTAGRSEGHNKGLE